MPVRNCEPRSAVALKRARTRPRARSREWSVGPPINGSARTRMSPLKETGPRPWIVRSRLRTRSSVLPAWTWAAAGLGAVEAVAGEAAFASNCWVVGVLEVNAVGDAVAGVREAVSGLAESAA